MHHSAQVNDPRHLVRLADVEEGALPFEPLDVLKNPWIEPLDGDVEVSVEQKPEEVMAMSVQQDLQEVMEDLQEAATEAAQVVAISEAHLQEVMGKEAAITIEAPQVVAPPEAHLQEVMEQLKEATTSIEATQLVAPPEAQSWLANIHAQLTAAMGQLASKYPELNSRLSEVQNLLMAVQDSMASHLVQVLLPFPSLVWKRS